MKLIACALPLLMGLPSVLAAQVNIRLPSLQRPTVRATLGPIAVAATWSGHGVSVRATPRSPRRLPTARGRTPAAASASAARVLSTADRYVGTRYRYGGDTPGAGFDCSGFVRYVFASHGVKLPRTSRLQAAAGQVLLLDLESLQPGDLLLFATGSRVNHVAIYVGGNRMLHSSAGAGGVVYDDLSTPRGKWYLKRHVGSRRVL